MQTDSRKRPHLAILIVIAAVGPLAMNILNPAVPVIEKYFSTSYQTAGLTLTYYLFALGVTQLIVGSLSDRFGRRPVVLVGTAVFIAGSIACIFASSIEALILGRILQAAGGCTGLVMGRTMIRDMYGMEKAASMMAYMVMIMVIVPIVAMPIGGFLTDHHGWQATMILAGIFASLALAFSLRWLHETHFDPQPMSGLTQMLGGFMTLLRNPRFNHHAFQTAFSSAAFFAFVGGSPKVMDEMGQDSTSYGIYFAIAGVFYMLGNLVTGRKSEKWGPNRLINLGTSAALLGGIYLVIIYLSGFLAPITLFAGMAVIAFGNGMSLPSGTTGAVSADLRRVGAAAGLAGFLQIAGGSLATVIVNWLLVEFNTAGPLVYVMATAVALAMVIHLAGSLHERRQPERSTSTA